MYQSHCGTFVFKSRVTDLGVADDSVILAKSLEVLVLVPQELHEERPLGLHVSWITTKVQVTVDLLNNTVQSVLACGDDIVNF